MAMMVGDRLGDGEAQGEPQDRDLERRHVDDDAGEPDEAEHQEAERHRVIGELRDQEGGEVEQDRASSLLSPCWRARKT